jgi:hypothetical protein
MNTVIFHSLDPHDELIIVSALANATSINYLTRPQARRDYLLRGPDSLGTIYLYHLRRSRL